MMFPCQQHVGTAWRWRSRRCAARSKAKIAAAAAEFHILINSKPQNPTKDELAAIITANLTTTAPALPALRRCQGTPQDAEWLALEAKLSSVSRRSWR
jgi:hypothetical protein